MQIRSVWELNFFFNYNNCNKSKNICVQNELDRLLNIWGKKSLHVHKPIQITLHKKNKINGLPMY